MRGIEYAVAGADRQSSSIDARLLRLQLRAGELPRNEHYKFDEAKQEFRALSASQVARSEVRALLAELAKAREPWRIEMLHRKIKLVFAGFLREVRQVDQSVQEQAAILRIQLNDGELPRGETYEWDYEAGEFRVAEKELIN